MSDQWTDADTQNWMKMTTNQPLRKVRSFILLGQGGSATSGGMYNLVEPLLQYGEVSVHDWASAGDVANAVNAIHPYEPVAIIGYSLGANDLGWIARFLKRHVNLGVAYDPSRKSPYAQYVNGEYVQRAPNFDKVISFYNPSTWFYGGSRYAGSNVEVVKINSTHLNVPNVPGLHERTISEVRLLAYEPKKTG